MQYITNDGVQIMGANYLEIVEKLRQNSFDPCGSVQEFMDATANACFEQTGAVISSYNEEQFVTDLLHNGFLNVDVKKVEDK